MAISPGLFGAWRRAAATARSRTESSNWLSLPQLLLNNVIQSSTTLNADVDVTTDNTLPSLMCPTTSTGSATRRTIELSKSRRWHRFHKGHKPSADEDAMTGCPARLLAGRQGNTNPADSPVSANSVAVKRPHRALPSHNGGPMSGSFGDSSAQPVQLPGTRAAINHRKRPTRYSL
jgi:hypothetical protein